MTDNVVPFVNWNSERPEDIMQQVIDWIKWHRERNHTVHVVGCLIHVEPETPDLRYYQPFFTPTPAEIIHYAGFRIQQRSWEKNSGGLTMRFIGEYRFLSNFYLLPIEYEGIIYPSSEHAYQAAKTRDANERKRIAGLTTPGEAKRAGRYVSIRSDWDKQKVAVMEDILRIKFANPEMKKMLVATHPKKIVEDNTWGDKFWGVYEGKGENHLGRLLMKIRVTLLEGK